MNLDRILTLLPYSTPFLFVDSLTRVDENGAEGTYTFGADLEFYRGHFRDRPVTPGVILTECCAQIGLVCLGIHLSPEKEDHRGVALSSASMEFYRPVYPGEKVRVVSDKRYFRFSKLRCGVKMFNNREELVCKGILEGMLKKVENG